ncbi:SLC13 family permease [Vibrio marisflavi]|nr:SLC13 family permease [Vibrio marisflavi]
MATIFGLIKYQRYPARVFGVALLALYMTNTVSTQQVLSSFSNQGLLTLILLMTCSLSLEKTKLLRVITSYVMKQNYKATWLRLFSLTVVSSAFLNNTAVVSTMLSPIRNSEFHSSSRLLIPLSYAAIFGGTLTLVGTSTNLIVNSMVLGQHGKPLGFFEFTPIGLSVVIVCGVLLYFISRLLPNKVDERPKASKYFIDAKVSFESLLVGKTIEANGLRNLESLFLVEILRRGRLISPVSPSEEIEAGDRLMFTGDIKKVSVLNQFDGLDLYAHKNGLPINNLREVVVKPESVLIGKSLKQTGFRALFDAAVVAMRRDGESISGKLGDLQLNAGDFLVLAVGDDFKGRHNIAKNFFLISGLEVEKLLNPIQERIAILGFFLAISLSAFGVLSLFKGMLLLLGVLLLSGSLNSNEIMQRIPKQIWLIISSALLLSHALINSGALEYFHQTVLANSSTLTPLIGLVAVYCLTWITTELVTNNAAAALIFPIAYSLAIALSANAHAYILAVAFGASASFISPYGYQTNLMVFNAGKYQLSDFVKVGVPISIAYGITVITAIYFFVGL